MMKAELLWLTFVTILTGLLWVPYVLDRLAVRGLSDTVGYPDNPKPQSLWAQRLMKAHANAVENLVIFATLVLAANALGVTGTTVAMAAAVYFFARVVHVLAYVFALPWVRTLAFSVGFIAQAVIALLIVTR
ncbi:MAG: MAPEG family protein [Burkholderiaceae bacterium]